MSKKKPQRKLRASKHSGKNVRGAHAANEEIYSLHIDARPVYHPASAVRVDHAMRDGKIHHDKTQHREKSKVLVFIWDKVQFVLVSVFVFAMIYTVLNWSALQINLSHYWSTWRGVESPLEDLVVDKAAAPEKLAVDPSKQKQDINVPPLNLEVYPPDMRLIIPRINQNVPVVGVKNENLIARKWDELESDIQKSLRSGIIHYPGTALPGDGGNIVLTGHSSYYIWDPGRFKDVFALLHDVKIGDKIVIFFAQKKFVYEVENIKVVLPRDVDILSPSTREQLTLVTCTPIGTNLKRLIVTSKLIEKS